MSRILILNTRKMSLNFSSSKSFTNVTIDGDLGNILNFTLRLYQYINIKYNYFKNNFVSYNSTALGLFAESSKDTS